MKTLKNYLFYEDSWCKIYCCDCREILPMLETVDLVLTDPPYGINYNPDGGNGTAQRCKWEKIVGDNIPFDPTFML